MTSGSVSHGTRVCWPLSYMGRCSPLLHYLVKCFGTFWLTPTQPFLHPTQLAHTPHTPTNSPPLPGLAHWTDIKVSALGSRVGWTPDRNNERTNDSHGRVFLLHPVLARVCVDMVVFYCSTLYWLMRVDMVVFFCSTLYWLVCVDMVVFYCSTLYWLVRVDMVVFFCSTLYWLVRVDMVVFFCSTLYWLVCVDMVMFFLLHPVLARVRCSCRSWPLITKMSIQRRHRLPRCLRRKPLNAFDLIRKSKTCRCVCTDVFVQVCYR